MKTTHKLFFAIPFDSATKNLYDRMSREIRKLYPGVTTVIGNEEVGPSPEYSDIASFKAQNRELTTQFVAQIQDADIVIADLTHSNPNVHVELGIALTENKNILRVTGRSVSELGFDIRNLQVHRYKDEAHLARIIMKYLDTFFKIKKLPISRELAPLLYCEDSRAIHLRAAPNGFDTPFDYPHAFIMRDGAVRVDFEILTVGSPEDWFGIYFRVGSSPFMGSHLMYVRQRGSVEIAVYPGPSVIKSVPTEGMISGRQMLTLQFENNYLEVQLGDVRLETHGLSHQVAGRVLPAAWHADVNIYSLEMICRDTIGWA
jgi:hypothetical protein